MSAVTVAQETAAITAPFGSQAKVYDATVIDNGNDDHHHCLHQLSLSSSSIIIIIIIIFINYHYHNHHNHDNHHCVTL